MPAPIPDLNRDQQCHHYQAPSGQRCGSPALKGEYYCYHHHIKHPNRNNRRVLIDPEVTRMELPPIEDRASIFLALAAVVHRLAENTIDTRRAGQMIYGLQVAMRALDPPPSQRCRTAPATECLSQRRPAAETRSQPQSAAACTNRSCHSERAQRAEEPRGTASAKTADTSPPPPLPVTIPITKESLLYFLRSRHCASCNAELFPASELTERRNAGAPPEIIEEARRALPAPAHAACTLPSFQAVAEESTGAWTTHKYGCPIHESPTIMGGEPPPQSTLTARFALHSPRRSVSLRLAHSVRCIVVRSSAARIPNSHQKANRRTKWQQ
jgi:hypothetical protein